MRRLVTITVTLAALAMADKASPAAVYCTQGAAGGWSLQRFKPLVRVAGGTVFTEMTFVGETVQEVKLRQFFPGWELAFDYRFDAGGRLTRLMGSVLVNDPVITLDGDTGPPVTTQWLAEADLTPGADGKIPQHHTAYSRDKDKIEKPEDADKYMVRFEAAPVYRTLQAVPCAAMLKDARALNATQG